jgi:hypothetical protein
LRWTKSLSMLCRVEVAKVANNAEAANAFFWQSRARQGESSPWCAHAERFARRGAGRSMVN